MTFQEHFALQENFSLANCGVIISETLPALIYIFMYVICDNTLLNTFIRPPVIKTRKQKYIRNMLFN